MSVAFDCAFEKSAVSQASPFSFVSNAGDVSGTPAANANRVLIAAMMASGITAPAITWNGVGMTLIQSSPTSGLGLQIHLFGLKNPASGAQTIQGSWTGGAIDVALGAVMLYNADQTTGWQNNGTNTGTGTACGGDITSANGNMAVAARVDDNASSLTGMAAGTSAWDERDLNGNSGQAYNASTGATTTITWTLGSSVNWVVAKVDVIAASGGGNDLSVNSIAEPTIGGSTF